MLYDNTFQKNASKLHKKVLKWFKAQFPQWEIIQEHPIKINGKTLYADFYSSKPFKFILEIQGRQHKEFVPHFHKTVAKFEETKYNDRLKREWAEMNDFKIIEVWEDEFKEEELESIILGALND